MKIKDSIFKKTYWVFGAVAYLCVSFVIIVFLDNLQHKIKRLPKVLMSAYKGPTVAISGSVVSRDNKKNPIAIRVIASERKKNPAFKFIVAVKEMPQSGSYEIKVPKRIGKVYVYATTAGSKDILTASVPASVISGEYPRNPVNVESQDINGVDVEINTR